MLRPTVALLWAACRPEPDDERVAAAVAEGADLDFAADVAVSQRVSPLLWAALNRVMAPPKDAHWVEALKSDAARCFAHSRMLLPRFGELGLAPLADAGIEPLVVKGLAVADAYPDPSLRPMTDVDLLLPPDQIRNAVACLQRAGWNVRPTPRLRPHELDLVHPELPGVPIDLHKQLHTWRDRNTRLSNELLWSWRVPATLQGGRAYVLPPEQHVLFIAAHAGKPFHTFDRLIWSVDIVAVAGKPGFDWDVVRRLATRADCRTALAVALTQARRLGLEVPDDLLEGAAAGTRRVALAPTLEDTWPIHARDDGTRLRLKLALVDIPAARAGIVASLLTRDFRAAPLRGPMLLSRGAQRWWRLRRGQPLPRKEQATDTVSR